MPLYEYKCDRCGDVFEVIQKFSDTPLAEHAGCGGHVERLLSPSALRFKGTGWYVTDYARGGNKGNAASAKTDAKDGANGTSKTDSSKPGSEKSSASTSAPDKAAGKK